MEKMIEVLERELGLIKTEISQIHEAREKALALAREINQGSRRAIESVHSRDLEGAKKLIDSIKELNHQMEDILSDYPGLYPSVYFAQKELVEAVMFYAIYTKSAIPDRNSLGVTGVAYLNGLGEITGELSRWMNSAMREENNADMVKEIFDWIGRIVAHIMPFVFFPDAVTANAKNTRDNITKIYGARERDLTTYLRDERKRIRDEEKKKREEKLIKLLSERK